MAIPSSPRSRLHYWASRHQNLVKLTLLLLIAPNNSVTEIISGTSEPTSAETSQYNVSSHPTGFPIQTVNLTIDYYDCPNLCSCHYDSPQQHLKISCRKPTTTPAPQQRQIPLTNGVSRLGLNHVTLDHHTLKSLTLLTNVNNSKLHELNLHHVSIDLGAFVTWDTFRTSATTLRKLRLCNVDLHPRAAIPDPYGDVMSSSHFSRLYLDSLSICNSSSNQLTDLLVSALPHVIHLSVLNSSLSSSSLDVIDVSRLGLTLQSLDLSCNTISTLPWGLFRELPKLTFLDLSQNHLEHLQEQVFVGLTALKKLNVSHNRIKYADAEVFTPLISLHSLDLSRNQLLQIFEPYFEDNVELRVLLMRQTWAHDSFIDSTTATRSLTEMDKLLDTLERVETLDLRDNQMLVIPESLAHLRHLKRVYLTGNRWSCSCFDRWVIHWFQTSALSNDTDLSAEVLCSDREPIASYLNKFNCTNRDITARTPRKYYGVQGSSKTLKCHPQKKGYPRVYWSLPRNGPTLHSNSHHSGSDEVLSDSYSSYHRVLSNGDLHISNLTTDAFGLYTCVAEYPDLNITHFIHLGVDTSIFLDVKLASIVIGWLTSLAFLMTVLSIQLIRFVLNKNGIDCPNITAPYKTRRIRRFFENMEQHKNSQLEWLRDNYNQQVKRVKDNCMYQVERIRESYTIQTKNLSDIRDYGAQQLQTVRDQYHDQIRRVSTYSTQQLCKVRENYVFQRNRVGKFSSHQMLRLRETYKWQAQTVNKILENLPKTLNFDACRGVGACGRTESIYLDELLEMREELDGGDLCVDMETAQELVPFVDLDPSPNHNSNPNITPDHVTLIIPSSKDTISTEDSEGHGDSCEKPTTIDPEDTEKETEFAANIHPIV